VLVCRAEQIEGGSVLSAGSRLWMIRRQRANAKQVISPVFSDGQMIHLLNRRLQPSPLWELKKQTNFAKGHRRLSTVDSAISSLLEGKNGVGPGSESKGAPFSFFPSALSFSSPFLADKSPVPFVSPLLKGSGLLKFIRLHGKPVPLLLFVALGGA